MAKRRRADLIESITTQVVDRLTEIRPAGLDGIAGVALLQRRVKDLALGQD